MNYHNNSINISNEIFAEIEELYPDQDKEGEVDQNIQLETSSFIVMNSEKIDYFTRRIMQELSIPYKFFIKKPDICIRKVIYADIKDLKQKKDKNGRTLYNISHKPEKLKPLEMFNSFFLQDLTLVKNNINSLKDDSVIRRYLGGGQKPQSYDVLKDSGTFLNLLDPLNAPTGRWPVSPEQSLAALQSAALSGILNHNPKDRYTNKKCFAINGPPGTGKTTLLTDLIANIYVKRAQELTRLVSPYDGFDMTKIPVSSLNGFEYYIQELNPKLQGFEIVVASTNNGAVENISKELPLKSKIYKDYHGDLNLFGWIWDTKKSQGQNWGTIAAVLGNNNNRNNFKNQFWDKYIDKNKPENIYDHFNMRNYLNYFKRLADGKFDCLEVIDNKTEHFVPEIFCREKFKDGSAKFDDVIIEQ